MENHNDGGIVEERLGEIAISFGTMVNARGHDYLRTRAVPPGCEARSPSFPPDFRRLSDSRQLLCAATVSGTGMDRAGTSRAGGVCAMACDDAVTTKTT